MAGRRSTRGGSTALPSKGCRPSIAPGRRTTRRRCGRWSRSASGSTSSEPALDVRLLVGTPDFPPTEGGIQLLVHRLVQHVGDADMTVVTLDAPGAEAVDRELSAEVVRVPRGSDHRIAVARLNTAVVRTALRRRPEAL